MCKNPLNLERQNQAKRGLFCGCPLLLGFVFISLMVAVDISNTSTITPSFSMLTLRAYESTPFHLSVENLKKKFENCLSAEKIDKLRSIERVFSLATIQYSNHCKFLSVILQSAIEEKACIVTYRKNNIEIDYPIQFFNISSAYGQWYVTGYNFETDSHKVFRCDKILDIKECSEYQSKSLDDFMKATDELYKLKDARDFEVVISERGADLFYKEHYPTMRLYTENGRFIIRGFYNKGEESFIANYFIAYGESIVSIYPTSLKKLIIERLNFLKKHIADI